MGEKLSENIVSLLGGWKINPAGDPEPDYTRFVRSTIIIVLGLMSLAYTAGNYTPLAKGIPGRQTALECKVEVVEKRLITAENKQEIYNVNIINMAKTMEAIQLDVREIRASQTREGRRQ